MARRGLVAARSHHAGSGSPRHGGGSHSSSPSPDPAPATPAVEYVRTYSEPIPPGAEIWFKPTKIEPEYGRMAAKNLVQGGLGAIGMGIGWLAIVIGTFFVVTVGLLGLLIGVLYLLNVAAGTI